MRGHSKQQSDGGTAAIPATKHESPPVAVLQAWGWPATVEVTSVPPGFSGAAVWKVTTPTCSFALKRWQADFAPDWPRLLRLCGITRTKGFPLLAQPVLTSQHQPVFEHAAQRWSVTTWMPGEPVSTPSDAQLQSALRRLAELHALWRRHEEHRVATSPAIQLKLERLQAWDEAALNEVKAKLGHEPLFAQALALLKRHLPITMQRLSGWRNRPLALQCIVGDLWAEHVLFTGDQVTGLIDLATVRLDHPAHDVARLLGSYCQGDAARRALALSWYPPQPDLEALVITLDEAGAVVAIGNWLRWLVLEDRSDLATQNALERLRSHMNRLQRQNRPVF
jgi:thiamine kinase-like enzyme